MKASRSQSIRDRQKKVCKCLVIEFEKATGINLTTKNRTGGFENSLWNRAVFYEYLNKNKGYYGLYVSKSLGIHHTTGMHYIEQITPYLKSSFEYDYNKTIDIIDNVYQSCYLQTFNN